MTFRIGANNDQVNEQKPGYCLNGYLGMYHNVKNLALKHILRFLITSCLAHRIPTHDRIRGP